MSGSSVSDSSAGAWDASEISTTLSTKRVSGVDRLGEVGISGVVAWRVVSIELAQLISVPKTSVSASAKYSYKRFSKMSRINSFGTANNRELAMSLLGC